MPRIEQEQVRRALHNHYFDHHVAMHLSRTRVEVYEPGHIGPDGRARPGAVTEIAPLLDPAHKCEDCKDMIEAGLPGSGRELLIMHHEMIRVLIYLLQKEGVPFGVKWNRNCEPGKPSRSQWVCDGIDDSYTPEELWDLDNPKKLPTEIRSLFGYADPDYLKKVFDGVRERVEVSPADPKVPDPYRNDGPIDKLGRFIEKGVRLDKPADGSGFHNTIHEYLGARERRSATGAEMNSLRHSLFNDYFWSLHLWIDGQYGRLLENLGENFETSPLEPGDPMDAMQKVMHARVKDRAMVAPVGP